MYRKFLTLELDLQYSFLGKQPQVPDDYENGCNPKPLWTL